VLHLVLRFSTNLFYKNDEHVDAVTFALAFTDIENRERLLSCLLTLRNLAF
jgi:hypothetical protein